MKYPAQVIIRTPGFAGLSLLFAAVPLLPFAAPPSAAAQSCGQRGVAVQVLGSGGPDVRDKRASSSYLVWKNGKSLILIDAGGGSALRFGESGAQMSQLDVILLTHLHADHTSDLPSLLWSSHFEQRQLPLPVFGPPGNDAFPSTTDFFAGLLGKSRGAWRYMIRGVQHGQGYEIPDVGGTRSYQLQPHDVIAGDTPLIIFRGDDLAV